MEVPVTRDFIILKGGLRGQRTLPARALITLVRCRSQATVANVYLNLSLSDSDRLMLEVHIQKCTCARIFTQRMCGRFFKELQYPTLVNTLGL